MLPTGIHPRTHQLTHRLTRRRNQAPRHRQLRPARRHDSGHPEVPGQQRPRHGERRLRNLTSGCRNSNRRSRGAGSSSTPVTNPSQPNPFYSNPIQSTRFQIGVFAQLVTVEHRRLAEVVSSGYIGALQVGRLVGDGSWVVGGTRTRFLHLCSCGRRRHQPTNQLSNQPPTESTPPKQNETGRRGQELRLRHAAAGDAGVGAGRGHAVDAVHHAAAAVQVGGWRGAAVRARGGWLRVGAAPPLKHRSKAHASTPVSLNLGPQHNHTTTPSTAPSPRAAAPAACPCAAPAPSRRAWRPRPSTAATRRCRCCCRTRAC
jgi:hypothetical protein